MGWPHGSRYPGGDHEGVPVILDDLATYIDAQSAAFTLLSGSAGNLAKGEMPDAAPAPDTLTALYETGGLGTLMSFSTGDQVSRQITRHRIQVLNRSTDYVTARNRAEEIYVLLDGLSRNLPTSTGTPYPSIEAVSPPFDIGRDRNERHLVSNNFDVWRCVAPHPGGGSSSTGGSTGTFTGMFSAAFSAAFDLVD